MIFFIFNIFIIDFSNLFTQLKMFIKIKYIFKKENILRPKIVFAHLN
jgi:hypothetical protein